MKKKYTDSDIQKILTDLSEFIPEIDPSDTEWKEFLKEFIAARPEVKLDAVLAKEIRQRLVQRAASLHAPKQFRFPQWVKFAGTFVAGAAVCAVVIIPILKIPDTDTAQVSERSLFYIPSEEIDLDGLAINSVEKLTLIDSEKVPEFDIAPMAVKRMIPVLEQNLSSNEEVMIASDSVIPEEKPRTDSFMKGKGILLLGWEDVPSDLEILNVAMLFVEEKGYAIGGDPFIDKWWEREGDLSPEFAPDYFEVVFPLANGAELRVKVDARIMQVVSKQSF